jgi:hypothetical protein
VVLALMAEGRSNAAIAAALVVGGGAVEKHINNIFAKLGLAPASTTTAASSPSFAQRCPALTPPTLASPRRHPARDVPGRPGPERRAAGPAVMGVDAATAIGPAAGSGTAPTVMGVDGWVAVSLGPAVTDLAGPATYRRSQIHVTG